MKVEIKKTWTPEERGFWRQYINYTRACICASAVKVCYEEFGFGERSRIPRMVEGIHRRVEELDALYGWEDQQAQRDHMARVLASMEVEYGKRYKTGKKQVGAWVHDAMYMVCMETLAKDFGFGVKREKDSREKMDKQSRLSKYFGKLEDTVAYVNHLNEGLKEDDERVVQYRDYFRMRLEACRFDEGLIERVMTWEVGKKRTEKRELPSLGGVSPFRESAWGRRYP